MTQLNNVELLVTNLLHPPYRNHTCGPGLLSMSALEELFTATN